MRCPSCGSQNVMEAPNCAGCGTPLGAQPGAQEPPLVPDSWFVQPRGPQTADAADYADPTVVEHRFADIPPAHAFPPGPPPPPRTGPSPRLLWAIAGGAVLVLVAVLIVVWPSGDPDRPAATNAATSPTPEPTMDASAVPVGQERFYVDTFAAAEGYARPETSGAAVGRLDKGTHYVFCKQRGERMERRGGAAYNHWWLLTNLDEVYSGGAPRAWVPALYLANWGNDEAKDNSGRDIPDCPS